MIKTLVEHVYYYYDDEIVLERFLRVENVIHLESLILSNNY